MATLHMLVGLPASGKSTWAYKFIEEQNEDGNKTIRVNKDDFRQMIDENAFSHGFEKFVTDSLNKVVSIALSRNISVVVDNTHISNYDFHEKNLRKIAETHNAEFKIHYFSCALEKLYQRDLKRSKMVGPNVIDPMVEQVRKNKVLLAALLY